MFMRKRCPKTLQGLLEACSENIRKAGDLWSDIFSFQRKGKKVVPPQTDSKLLQTQYLLPE